ncbi:unnamed protein product [Lactuca saligna]|uniref:Uncharacterized protein n=1 Tax=Lactuca saligna TaxID=75948 RepID=A0AA36EG06_LACSI|nr:unnamed protein product [Lactuca saligna]
MHFESTTVNELIGLLLQEEARQEADLAPQVVTLITTNPSVTPSTPFPVANQLGHEGINYWQRENQTEYPSRRLVPRDSQRQAGPTSPRLFSILDPNCYFETGATDHVTPDIRKLYLQEPYTGEDKLQVGKTFQGKPLIHDHFDNGLYRLSPPSNKMSSTMALSGVHTS